MAKYRKKPVIIEAFQYYPSMPMYDIVRNLAGIPEDQESPFERQGDVLLIHTLEGAMVAKAGDWIIKGVKGEFYPCRDYIFRLTYEPMEVLAE